MQRCSRVVKDGVDEDDEVGEFEGVSVAAVNVVDANLDDVLEVLQRECMSGLDWTNERMRTSSI